MTKIGNVHIVLLFFNYSKNSNILRIADTYIGHKLTVHFYDMCVCMQTKNKETNSMALSPRANYTD
jgi:hypothetical protein